MTSSIAFASGRVRKLARVTAFRNISWHSRRCRDTEGRRFSSSSLKVEERYHAADREAVLADREAVLLDCAFRVKLCPWPATYTRPAYSVKLIVIMSTDSCLVHRCLAIGCKPRRTR
jgi:hypothetical protein